MPEEVDTTPTEPPFIAAGDLADIIDSGTLRVLLPLGGEASRLPRSGSPLDLERELASRYASLLGVEPTFVYVESRADLLPSLVAGRGDLVAANLTATEQRREEVAFTVPLAVAREQLVARASDTIADVDDLAGRTLHVRRSSSFWTTAVALACDVPTLTLESLPETVDTEAAIAGVADGRYDLTIVDSNVLDDVMLYRDDVRPAVHLGEERPIAWAVRRESTSLLANLDDFLTEAQLSGSERVIHFDDLAELKQRKTLRVLTRNQSTDYFLWRGQLRGFEYELAREFARQQGLRLEIVVPPTDVDLYSWLLEGRGDLIAASQTPSPERAARGVTFSRPYGRVTSWVVAPIDFPQTDNVAELAGVDFFVKQGTSHWSSLLALQREGVAVRPHPAPDSLGVEEIIEEVAAGRVGLTVADGHLLDIELSFRDDVKRLVPVSENQPLAWAVRATNPQLLEAVDAFIRREYRGLFYNMTYNKYFKDPTKIQRYQRGRFASTGRLSPYDDIVRAYADEHGFDWRLIVAQMYQESLFDPNARSFAGAEGLMQVLPETAASLGFETMHTPDEMIHAGVRYMEWVRDRFPTDLPVADRMWFSLAAYNAGLGHVQEGRRLAREQGLNPNRWFDNVERAMLLLKRPQYAAESRYGYCRCDEPVRYVRQIVDRYQAYLDASEDQPVWPLQERDDPTAEIAAWTARATPEEVAAFTRRRNASAAATDTALPPAQ